MTWPTLGSRQRLPDLLEEMELQRGRDAVAAVAAFDEPGCSYCTATAVEACGLCGLPLCEDDGVREGHVVYCPDCLGFTK